MPVFDDRDAGDLYYTMSYTQPDNVRGLSGDPLLRLARGEVDRLFGSGVAIGSAASVRINLWTDTSQPNDTFSASVAGALAALVLKTRGTEDTDWPTSCTKGTGNTDAPVFDDPDGDDLYYTLSYTLPDNVRGVGGEAAIWVDSDRLWAKLSPSDRQRASG